MANEAEKLAEKNNEPEKKENVPEKEGGGKKNRVRFKH